MKTLMRHVPPEGICFSRATRQYGAIVLLVLNLAACGGGGGSGSASAGPPGVPLAAGSLDTSFGMSGKTTMHFPSGVDDSAHAVAVQADGKIILAGSTLNGTTYNFALARLNSDGSPDTTFDVDGMVETDISVGRNDFASALAIQSDGKIVVAGSSVNAGSQTVFALVRYNSDGSLDTTFGSGGLPGIVRTSFGAGSRSEANAVAIQSDGKIVVAGYTLNGTVEDFALARYNSDGSLDTSFDSDGRVTTDFAGGGDHANALAIQSDGKLVAAGQTYSATTTLDFAIARYNPDGSLDAGFNGTGMVSSNYGTFLDAYHAVAIQSDGKIIAAGYTRTGVWDDFAVARYNSNGTLDVNFGGSGTGVAVTDLGGFVDKALALAIQSDGKIVAAGNTNDGRGSVGDDMAIVRYNIDGSPDNTFDGDGKTTVDFAADGDNAVAITLQADGKIIVAGASFNGVDYDFAAVRLNP